jgi:tRNA (Thr-GGU) A37 N-methylase
MSMDIKYTPIGIIHSPFKAPKGVPVQAAVARDVNGTIEVFPEYRKGLKDGRFFWKVFRISFCYATSI